MQVLPFACGQPIIGTVSSGSNGFSLLEMWRGQWWTCEEACFRALLQACKFISNLYAGSSASTIPFLFVQASCFCSAQPRTAMKNVFTFCSLAYAVGRGKRVVCNAIAASIQNEHAFPCCRRASSVCSLFNRHQILTVMIARNESTSVSVLVQNDGKCMCAALSLVLC